jgi:hypothetical protein
VTVAVPMPPIFYEPAYPGQYPARWRVGAHRALTRAVRRGELPRPTRLPCLACGRRASHYHHHLGYHPDRWLDAVPVCAGCHLREHYRLDAGIGSYEPDGTVHFYPTLLARRPLWVRFLLPLPGEAPVSWPDVRAAWPTPAPAAGA